MIFYKKNYEKKESKITFKIGDYYQVFNLKEIAYLKADGSYTRVVMNAKGKHPVTLALNLKTVSSYLDDSFYRIHKSYVVNLDCIIRLYGNRVEISTGEILDVSLTYKSVLWNILNVVTGGKNTKEKQGFTKE